MLALSSRKAVRAVVEEARHAGPQQPWVIPPKPVVPESRKGRFCYSSAELRQDPKILFASEIAQSFAEGVLAACDGGWLDVAYMRARSAADWESKHCRPGIYQQLFILVSKLVEQHGREKKEKKMPTEQEQLKDMEEELHKISVKALGIKRYGIAGAIINTIKQIKAELTPKRQMQLDLNKNEGE